MIPKKIHYCWFGGNPKSELINNCIESWKRFLPDYEIIEWNETNFDCTFSAFAQAAYDEKKWAFVSDVARLKIIYDYGGIYLDTDVELFSSQINRYLGYSAFFFFDNIEYVNTGVGFGAKVNSPIVKRLLDDYEWCMFDLSNLKQLACPRLNTFTLQQAYSNLLLDNTTQIIGNVAFVSQAEYCTFAKHYGAFSWRTEEDNNALMYACPKRPVSKLRQKIQESALISILEKHKLKKLKKFTIFVLYDLWDFGLLYWTQKLVQKILGNIK